MPCFLLAILLIIPSSRSSGGGFGSGGSRSDQRMPVGFYPKTRRGIFSISRFGALEMNDMYKQPYESKKVLVSQKPGFSAWNRLSGTYE